MLDLSFVIVQSVQNSVEGQNSWIGLNDMKTNLNFEWTTGADVSYTNWGRHQPTVNPGLEQHAVIISPVSSLFN